MRRHIAQRLAVAGLMVILLVVSGETQPAQPPLGLGRTPTAAEIQAWDIAIGPDGKELPAGQGTAREGAGLYRDKCAMCHGENGSEGPQDVLVGGQESLATAKPVRTIGSFWPYATTIYDYLYRAMPLYAPGSLPPHEVYALTAYLLFRNGIVGEDAVIDAQTLPKIRMPNRDGFRPDPRPEREAP
ncbi:MAG TPA: cytochrome c [Candidatus Tectomicrobia bacterium]